MIQEFDISITAVGDDKYLVRTESFAPGVPLAEEQLIWPVERWLQESKVLMHDPLLGLAKGQSGQPPAYRSGSVSESDAAANVPSIVSLGQSLYKELFCGLLRDSWLAAQSVAQNRGYLLRLRLGIRDGRLQQLPWEVLHGGDRPLATVTDIAFSRYSSDHRRTGDYSSVVVPDYSQPLRILMVIAAPSDQDRLDLKNEVRALQAELHPPAMRSGRNGNESAPVLDVQLEILEQPGRAELTQTLEQGNFQAFHYAGHSNLGTAGGDLYLVSGQTGLTERLSGEDLAGLLVNNGVKLAVFNSCRGAYTPDTEPGWKEQNLAQALVSRGIPAVVAMAEQIPDHVAIHFTKLLYRNLRKGSPIDLSLNRTRQALLTGYGSDQYYWALPILSMQPNFNGYLSSSDGVVEDEFDRLLFQPARPSLNELARPNRPSSTPSPDSREPALTDAPVVPVGTGKPSVNAQGIQAQGIQAQGIQAQGIQAQNTERPIASPPADDINETDLEDLVETLEYEELLSYSEDTEVMADLVKQLSQPPTPDKMVPADDSESLLPEPLETPGLSIYDDLPTEAPTPVGVRSPEQPGPSGEAGLSSPAGETSAAVESPVSAAAPSDAKPLWQRRSVVVAGGAIAALAVVGLTLLSSEPTPNPDPTEPATSETFLQAEQALSLEDYDAAANQIGILIREQDYQAALDLLNANQASYLSSAEIAFLRGRIQWERYRQNPLGDFDIDTVIVSWKSAVNLQPDWPDALIALGFAYYEKGEYDRAAEFWEQAVDVADSNDVYVANAIGASVEPSNGGGIINAQAGLAMAYFRASNDELDLAVGSEKLDQALEQKQLVMTQAGRTFLRQNLGLHWLWTEKAVGDWASTKTELNEVQAARSLSEGNE
ncbi:MAG: CHAT domain-containing protein [Cyanobacteria bacterium J06628_6]